MTGTVSIFWVGEGIVGENGKMICVCTYIIPKIIWILILHGLNFLLR